MHAECPYLLHTEASLCHRHLQGDVPGPLSNIHRAPTTLNSTSQTDLQRQSFLPVCKEGNEAGGELMPANSPGWAVGQVHSHGPDPANQGRWTRPLKASQTATGTQWAQVASTGAPFWSQSPPHSNGLSATLTAPSLGSQDLGDGNVCTEWGPKPHNQTVWSDRGLGDRGLYDAKALEASPRVRPNMTQAGDLSCM